MITLYFRWLRPMGILFLLCVQERPAFSERVAKEAAVSQATKSQRVRYAALIERAAKLLSAGEFIAAYSAASQAANLNERGYEAPYYCALALYKQDALPSADTYLQKALALVPPEAEKQRQLITTLRKVVADKQTFLDLVKIARADVQAGYIAKAAEEFTAAFTLFPTAQDIGLQAAQLWNERGEVKRTAKLLAVILPGAHNPAILQEARALWGQIEPKLDAIYGQLLVEGQRQLGRMEFEEAAATFSELADLFPTRTAPQLWLARTLARQHKSELAGQAILAALRRDKGMSFESLLEDATFLPLFEDLGFQKTLLQAFGPQSQTKMQAELALWDASKRALALPQADAKLAALKALEIAHPNRAVLRSAMFEARAAKKAELRQSADVLRKQIAIIEEESANLASRITNRLHRANQAQREARRYDDESLASQARLRAESARDEADEARQQLEEKKEALVPLREKLSALLDELENW